MSRAGCGGTCLKSQYYLGSGSRIEAHLGYRVRSCLTSLPPQKKKNNQKTKKMNRLHINYMWSIKIIYSDTSTLTGRGWRKTRIIVGSISFLAYK
jgi:hypothetical protein